jgi:hypothetical protein
MKPRVSESPPPPKTEWHWDIVPGHWIDLYLGDTGLSYMGTDWNCQSGGGYMAGSQSITEFLERGGIAKMPDAIAAEVRAAIAARAPGHMVTVRVAGPSPDEAHLDLDGQPRILRGTGELFRGPLPAGEHRISGILLYPGADGRGRRNAKRFERAFEVAADIDIIIDDLKPRWPQ